MAVRMTWDEIKKAYPAQFVYLSDVVWDKKNDSTVLSAIVEYASEQPDSKYQIRAMKGELFQDYTAPGTTLHFGALSA